MFLRILAVAGPFWIYATLAVLMYGLFRQRNRLEWLALAPAAIGFLASALLLAPIHRLFFDEDIYINVASDLARVPVNQTAVMGGPNDIDISTYPKEPAGWPVLLSLAFLAGGAREPVAFWFARFLYALTIAAVYHLARALLAKRTQANVAAILFGATPICFWYSVSAGSDMTAALMAVLGMWGTATGNGALAAAGFAFAAQTRMELLLLVPLVWLSPRLATKWKIAAAALALFEVVHVGWVISVTPLLERAEEVSSAFGAAHIWRNLFDNTKYLFNPFAFPIAVSVLAILSVFRRSNSPPKLGGEFRARTLLAFWLAGLFTVYLCFYAGSFDTNARYSIQIVAPLTVLAASFAKRPVWIAALLLSAVIPATQQYGFTSYLQALEADHSLSVLFASRLEPDDLMISSVQQIFINNGRRSINAAFASMNKTKLEDEIRKRRQVWYHAGVRSNDENTDEWRADRWVKSNFDLHLIDSHEVGGFTIAFYRLLLKGVDGETR